MKKIRVIVSLGTINRQYVVGSVYPEGILQSIEYRRSGYAGIYQGGDETNYFLAFKPIEAVQQGVEGPLQRQSISYTLIPYSKITSVTFIEQEVQEEVPQARRAEAQ